MTAEASNTTHTIAAEPLLIDTKEILKLLGGLSRAGYHKARSSGRFAPMAIKIGKKVLHRYQEVKDWVNAGCPPASKWEWGGIEN